MLEGMLQVESELRRQGQELAVAWRRGRAAFVLDSLGAETPLRAAVLASLIHELLARWDPLEGKWPVGFWRALVCRSEGWLTPEELQELTGRYQRKFGRRPPAPDRGRRSRSLEEQKRSLENRARRIREALDVGEPIPRPPTTTSSPPEFLRSRRALS